MEEFERCKKEAVEKTVEKFFPDIEGKEKWEVCVRYVFWRRENQS